MNDKYRGVDSTPSSSFDEKKWAYFVELGLSLRKALATHALSGLRDVNESGYKEWGNISEHCIVEAARARVLSGMLMLDDTVRFRLIEAAMLHDHNKRYEVEIGISEGATWASFAKSTQQSRHALVQAGYDAKTIQLTESAGHGAVTEIEKIVLQKTHADHDIACMVMYYIDAYTIGSEWVDSEGSLRTRMEGNARNPRYHRLNEEGRNHFEGETTFEAMLRVGELTEAKLAELITGRSGIFVDPSELAYLIDERIKDEISQVSLS